MLITSLNKQIPKFHPPPFYVSSPPNLKRIWIREWIPVWSPYLLYPDRTLQWRPHELWHGQGQQFQWGAQFNGNDAKGDPDSSEKSEGLLFAGGRYWSIMKLQLWIDSLRLYLVVVFLRIVYKVFLFFLFLFVGFFFVCGFCFACRCAHWSRSQ